MTIEPARCRRRERTLPAMLQRGAARFGERPLVAHRRARRGRIARRARRRRGDAPRRCAQAGVGARRPGRC